MRQRVAGALAALALLVPAPAHAHRLDEYLEQTLIEVESTRFVLRVDLTAGVGVASSVASMIDQNRDGAFDGAEQSAYSERVRGDLELRLGERALPLQLIEARYPSADAMGQGVGTISLTFDAPLSQGLGPETLRLVNRHAGGDAVYLVNVTTPPPPYRVLSQSRSPDQSTYEARIDFGGGAISPRLLAAATLLALVLGGGSLLAYAHRRAATKHPAAPPDA